MTAEPSKPAKPELPEYIGTASMKPDGTIILFLRAEAEDGSVGHSMLTYPPDHKDYKSILKHLGGMKPGEEKSVRPWPDE